VAVTLFLADKSAQELVRRSEQARQLFITLAESNQLAVCEVIALEVIYSARSRDHARILRRQLDAMVWLEVTNTTMRRALDIQTKLLDRGQHRLPIPDLLIAATAEQYDAVMLHYDSDFETIAAVTGQPVRWVVPRGTV
jgi:predicted nucleic acid-binding protein